MPTCKMGRSGLEPLLQILSMCRVDTRNGTCKPFRRRTLGRQSSLGSARILDHVVDFRRGALLVRGIFRMLCLARL
uniref:Uncharacterized protein n=1 Tax=Candidatus Methanogaster sp. ANME-2c ERB4 TaxID=2759911 RepID=A0A7G9Y070_9EURY|nr:hypothetical protein EGIHLHMO_00001 [Methanosarcinales archaeon ANME-2c ERB4]